MLLALPGNHDIPLFNLLGRALRPYAGFSGAFGPDRAPCWQDDTVQITTVDTTRPWRHIDGEISADQIDAVARRLRSATPRQVRVVACHHPLAVPGPGEAKNLVRNHEAALRHWADAGADIVLGGHIHLPAGVSSDEVINLMKRGPDRSHTYESGKRWIPLYFGNDARRMQVLYQGEGCLIYAAGSRFGAATPELIRVDFDRSGKCYQP